MAPDNNISSNNSTTAPDFVNMSCHISTYFILLGIALIHAFNRDGNSIPLRAVIDSGSQINLITQRGAQKLEFPISSSHSKLIGVNSCPTAIKDTILSVRFYIAT